MFLVRQGAVGEAALAMGIDGLSERVPGFALVQAGVAAPPRDRALQPIEGESPLGKPQFV